MDTLEGEILISNDPIEKEDLDSLRGLITLGGNPNELIIPYLQGLDVQKNRLATLKRYIQTQKLDKKNKFLLDLIENLS
jgi:hypothetical protein